MGIIKAFNNEAELINCLIKFNFDKSLKVYIDNNNLRTKTPDQILHFTFGTSIARAFRYESPKFQYLKWAETINTEKVINDLNNINSQKDYDYYLFNFASLLLNSWEKNNEKGHLSRMNIGIRLKIINLLFKHLYFCCLHNNEELISYLHVPWDKFTLQPLKEIWNGMPKINSSSSQGFVDSIDLYKNLHNLISDISEKAARYRIVYEFLAWDSEH